MQPVQGAAVLRADVGLRGACCIAKRPLRALQVLRSALVILGILASAGAASAAAAAGGKQQQLGPLLAAVLSSQASGISNSSSSSSVTAALGSHAFPPLDDDDIAIINGAQQQQQPAGAPYLYTSGLPPLEALLNGSTAAHTLSWDQQQQPAAGTERVSWLVRTYTCTGEALLKLRLSNEMQMIIRDAVSESVSAAVNVPQHQVELFASGNISLALSIAGVRWPDSSGGSLAEATPGSHAGLAAVRDALSQLSGGYDKDHIDVSFASPAPAAALVETSTLLAPSPSQAMRKLLLQQQQQQSGEAAAVTVYARFHGMAPANATSLLRRLASTCSPRAPGEHVAPASLVAGTSVTRVCANTFRLAFKDHGVMSSPAAFAVTPVAQPQASVALSVAVALTPSQLAVDKDEQVIEWLNSSSVQDILHDLNLEAVPAGLLSLLNSTAELAAAAAAVESGDKSGGGALAGLLPLLLQQSPAAAAASGGHSVSRGMVAGVVVAGAVSALALIGVGVLLVRQRRPARASAGGLPTSRSSSAQGLRRKVRGWRWRSRSHACARHACMQLVDGTDKVLLVCCQLLLHACRGGRALMQQNGSRRRQRCTRQHRRCRPRRRRRQQSGLTLSAATASAVLFSLRLLMPRRPRTMISSSQGAVTAQTAAAAAAPWQQPAAARPGSRSSSSILSAHAASLRRCYNTAAAAAAAAAGSAAAAVATAAAVAAGAAAWCRVLQHARVRMPCK